MTREVLPDLKPMQQMFADLYLTGKTGTDAAKEAGYAEKNAHVTASRLLSHDKVSQYIAARRAVLAKKSRTDQQKIIDELRDMAFFNLQDVSRLDADGDVVVDYSQAERRHFSVITKVKNKTKIIYGPNGSVLGKEKQTELGLADKYRGLELLGKHLGMFKEAEQRVTIDISDRLLSARARVMDALPPPVSEDLGGD